MTAAYMNPKSNQLWPKLIYLGGRLLFSNHDDNSALRLPRLKLGRLAEVGASLMPYMHNLE